MVKQFGFLLLLILFVTIPFRQCLAQTNKPKIGLVLSGGGAKGLAHIRIIQVLDSLGIVPDYIAGTSMGSVVGAFYAAGYTGNQIDSIAKSIPWDRMFTNNVSFDEINIEEKDEFGRYIYELPLKGLKPQFPLGVVEGQQIEEILNKILFPVNGITDFNKLPTPFLCVASDIVKGEPVILRKGSLPVAVRASMSIPTVFSPVRLNGRLLIDGGVYVNLPVTYCREMGADFIIAVDVGGGLLKEEELTSPATLLVQTTFLMGYESYQKEKEKSDIFVDVVKYLKYGTMDFERGNEMMESGDSAVKEVMPQLVQLAERLKQFKVRKIRRIEEAHDTYKLQDIELDGVSADNSKLVTRKFSWKSGDFVSSQQIGESVHRLMGTRLFNKISYAIDGDSVQSVLTIKANEKLSNTVKFAIHYDSDRGAGLILNFTKRNFLLPASRLFTTLNLAETPRGRINYYYYFGKQFNWWHQTDVYGEKVILNSFFNGTPIPDLVSTHAHVQTNINYTINQNCYWGVGGFWQWNQLKPKIDPRTENNPDPLGIIEYSLKNTGVRTHFVYNTFDKVYFPSKGNIIKAEVLSNFGNPVRAKLFFYTTDTTFETTFKGNIQNYFRINIKEQKNIELAKKLTLQARFQIGLTQDISASTDKYSSYSLAAGDYIFVGGQLNRPRANNYTFIGLEEGELVVPQLMTAGAQLQWNIAKNIYLIPAINILAAGYESSDYWKTLGEFHFTDNRNDGAFYQVGYGITAGYMSLIGPISVTVSNDAQIGKVRFFLNVGFNY